MTNLTWRDAVKIDLVDGYVLTDSDGRQTGTITDARVAYEGGFVHVDIPGVTVIQTVSAPAIRRIQSPRARNSPFSTLSEASPTSAD